MIRNLKLINVRKFNKLELSFNNNLIILIGKNAVGKTTILESIYAISTSKSHRSDDFKQMISTNKPFSHILLEVDKKYELIFSEKGKKAIINQLEYKKISDFVGNLKTVLFSPNDLFLIIGSKSERRNFLDLELSLLDKIYLESINTYKKILKQRNDLLKIYDESKKIILEVITTQLIEQVKIIINKRLEFIKDLNFKLKDIHILLTNNENLKLEYNPSISLDKLEQIFKEKLNYDILTKMTNYGPHRDDFKINLNELEASSFASQGQIRGIAISLKIALLEIIKEKSKKEVILLLDDVFSELDDNRQSNLVKYLFSQSQTFITTTNVHSLPKELLQKSQVIKIEE